MQHMENMHIPMDNCPVAAPSQVTVYTRVLHRACQMTGCVERLAARPRVPAATLYRWLDGAGGPARPRHAPAATLYRGLDGEAEPPTPVFLKAVDIVMPAWSGEDELFAQALR